MLVLSPPFMLLSAPCVICRLSSTVDVSFLPVPCLRCYFAAVGLSLFGRVRFSLAGLCFMRFELNVVFVPQLRGCACACPGGCLNVVFHPQLRLASCVAHGSVWGGPHSRGYASIRCIRLLAFHEGGQKPRRGPYYGGGCRYSLLCSAPPTAFLPSLWAGRG